MSRLLKHISVILVLSLNSACVIANPMSISVEVVDQSGQPIEDAQVFARYRYSYRDDVHEKNTNEDGKVHFLDSEAMWTAITVKKEGYYESIRGVGRSMRSSLTVDLQKKRSPVPMFARNVTLYFPKKKEKIGFDFKKGDWVQPYGDGEKSHIFFELEGVNRGIYDGKGVL